MESRRTHIALIIGAVIAVVLQIVVAPNIAIGFAVPNFLLSYVVVVAVALARSCDLVMPFILGLVFDFVGGGPVGAAALLFVIATYIIAAVFRRLENDTLFMPIVTIIVSVLVMDVLYGVLMLICGLSESIIDALIYRSLPCALYDCVFALIMYPLVVRFIAPRSSRQPKIPLVS